MSEMYEILRIYETVTTGNCFLRVAAGTTGKRGGDTGHGCRTIVELECVAGDIEFQRINGGVRIVLGGDEELESIIEALSFAAKTLEEHRDDKPVYV